MNLNLSLKCLILLLFSFVACEAFLHSDGIPHFLSLFAVCFMFGYTIDTYHKIISFYSENSAREIYEIYLCGENHKAEIEARMKKLEQELRLILTHRKLQSNHTNAN